LKGEVVIDVARSILVIVALILSIFLYTDMMVQQDILVLTLVLFMILGLLDSIRITKLKEEVKD